MNKTKVSLIVLTVGLIFFTIHFNVLDRLSTSYYFLKLYYIYDSDMGWGADFQEQIENLKLKVGNNDFLIDLMLNNGNASIAAEGMILAFEVIQDYDELLAKLEPYDFENDERWNYFVYNNQGLYQDLLIAARVRAGITLTEQDMKNANIMLIDSVFKIPYAFLNTSEDTSEDTSD